MEFLQLMSYDLLAMFFDIKSDDLVFPLCMATWLFMLALPMETIDRRDEVSFFTFQGIMLTLATAMFVVLPSILLHDQKDAARIALILLICAVIVTFRWFMKRAELKPDFFKEKEEQSNKKA